MKLAGFVRKPFRACEAAGVTPRFLNFHGKDALAFVVSLNLHRRHLNESQRSMVSGRIANLRRGRPSENSSIEPISIERAAEMMNVSPASVKRAREVIDRGAPELVKAVESGRVSVSAAAEVAELPTRSSASSSCSGR